MIYQAWIYYTLYFSYQSRFYSTRCLMDFCLTCREQLSACPDRSSKADDSATSRTRTRTTVRRRAIFTVTHWAPRDTFRTNPKHHNRNTKVTQVKNKKKTLPAREKIPTTVDWKKLFSCCLHWPRNLDTHIDCTVSLLLPTSQCLICFSLQT